MYKVRTSTPHTFYVAYTIMSVSVYATRMHACTHTHIYTYFKPQIKEFPEDKFVMCYSLQVDLLHVHFRCTLVTFINASIALMWMRCLYTSLDQDHLWGIN